MKTKGNLKKAVDNYTKAKKEINKKVSVSLLTGRVVPEDWIKVETIRESKVGDFQVRMAHKKSDHFCYVNINKETGKLKSRFFCSEKEGRENYIPKKKVNYREDGTVSSVTIYKGGKQYVYCMNKKGLESFKVIVK